VEDEELYAQALELLTCSVKEYSIDEGIAYQLAISYGRLGEYTPNLYYLLRAIDLLESLVKLDPEEEHIWYELGYTLLTLSETFSSCLQVGDREKARWAAERALLRAAELGSGKSCYFLACLYSLVGLYDASILYLRKAKVLGVLPMREELMEEEWLEGVRSSVDFQEFII
jgi:tetratricopeptide (TPR) repeat protein